MGQCEDAHRDGRVEPHPGEQPARRRGRTDDGAHGHGQRATKVGGRDCSNASMPGEGCSQTKPGEQEELRDAMQRRNPGIAPVPPGGGTDGAGEWRGGARPGETHQGEAGYGGCGGVEQGGRGEPGGRTGRLAERD